jgi:hypothetical protein
MGLPVLLLGETGSGKTYSIKNFSPDEVGIFAVEKPYLPFKKDFKVAKNADYDMIATALLHKEDGKVQPKLKRYVIDDSQYLLVNELFDRVKETGYNKFTEMAVHFRNLIHNINKWVPDDVIVYFLHHPEMDQASNRYKAKTIGKMLDEKLTVEGCFNIVLFADVEGSEHKFITQSDGVIPAKSPEGMFELKIPNDLKAVDDAIREYYGLEG